MVWLCAVGWSGCSCHVSWGWLLLLPSITISTAITASAATSPSPAISHGCGTFGGQFSVARLMGFRPPSVAAVASTAPLLVRVEATKVEAQSARSTRRSAKSLAGGFDFGCCCQRQLQPDLEVFVTLTSMQDKSPEPLSSIDPSGSRSLKRHPRSEHQRPVAIGPRGLQLLQAKKCRGLPALRPFSVSSLALATRLPPMASVRPLEPTASVINMLSWCRQTRH